MKDLPPLVVVCSAALWLLALPQDVQAQLLSKGRGTIPPNADVRSGGSGLRATTLTGKTAAQMNSIAETQFAATNRAVGALKSKVPGAEVTVSAVTGSVEVVRSSQFLTGAAPGRAAAE